MADPALSIFVKEALAAGKSRGEISEALKRAGWPDDQAEHALAAFADIDFAVPVPRPRVYGSAREAFLYIVYFSLLGTVAGQLGSLAFAFVDKMFEDKLTPYAWEAGAYSLRWAISALLVGYPIFLVLGSWLAAQRQRDLERRTSRVRAWLTYVTLIFAAGTMIGDLVAVVYQFLSGEIGVRFAAKAAIVGAIAGAILFNYGRVAERMGARTDWTGRALAIVATVIIVALVGWGFAVVKSPGHARAMLSDEKRLDDLVLMTRLVDCYVRYEGETPESVAQMENSLAARVKSGGVASGCAEGVPHDPSTGAAYGYERIGANKFGICAVFEYGWPENAGDLKVKTPRRFAWRRSGDAGEQQYVDLPRRGGEACFSFNVQPPNEEENNQTPDGK